MVLDRNTVDVKTILRRGLKVNGGVESRGRNCCPGKGHMFPQKLGGTPKTVIVFWGNEQEWSMLLWAQKGDGPPPTFSTPGMRDPRQRF